MKRKLIALLAASVGGLLATGPASASAFAQPEISPTPTPSRPISFTGTGGAAFQIPGYLYSSCSTATIKGKFINATEAEASITYEECSNMPYFKETRPLRGKLGSVSPLKWVGLKLEPEGGVFANNFGYVRTSLTGSVIGTVGPAAGAGHKSPVNRELESFTLEYWSNGESEQIPSKFEVPGEAEGGLYADGTERTLLTSTLTLKNFKRGEIPTQIEIKD